MIDRALKWLFDEIRIEFDNDAFAGGMETNRASLLLGLLVAVLCVGLPLGIWLVAR